MDPLRVFSHNHNNPLRGQHFIAVACFQKTAHSLVALRFRKHMFCHVFLKLEERELKPFKIGLG